MDWAIGITILVILTWLVSLSAWVITVGTTCSADSHANRDILATHNDRISRLERHSE